MWDLGKFNINGVSITFSDLMQLVPQRREISNLTLLKKHLKGVKIGVASAAIAFLYGRRFMEHFFSAPAGIFIQLCLSLSLFLSSRSNSCHGCQMAIAGF